MYKKIAHWPAHKMTIEIAKGHLKASQPTTVQPTSTTEVEFSLSSNLTKFKLTYINKITHKMF